MSDKATHKVDLNEILVYTADWKEVNWREKKLT